MFKGYKTYIVAFIGIVVNGAIAMGYIAPEYFDVINSALAFLGLGTLRAGIAKVK